MTTTILDWGNGGTIEENLPHDYSQDYFTVEALATGTVLYLQQSASPLQYSLNGGAWTTYNGSISVVNGDNVRFKGTNNTVKGSTGSSAFRFSNNVNVSGDIMSLLYEDNYIGQTTLSTPSTFSSLFVQESKLISAANLILPATTLSQGCYSQMFTNCTSLTSVPKLPATTLANYCYSNMFNNCSSLIVAPELPAKILMENCYDSMFSKCSSLIESPELPALILVSNCYKRLFQNCSSLSRITAAFITAPGSSYTSEWVYGVASTGTFVKSSAATWNVTGTEGVPSGWTVQTY